MRPCTAICCLHPKMKRWFAIAALVVCAVALVLTWRYLDRVARAIERQSTIDEVRPADVIVVLGAADIAASLRRSSRPA